MLVAPSPARGVHREQRHRVARRHARRGQQIQGARQAKAGIKTIKFDAATAKKYYDNAYAVGWAGIIKVAPDTGPQLKKLLSK